MPARMFHDEVQCSSRLGLGIVAFATENGGDARPLIAQVGLSESDFEPPFKRISLDRYTTLLELLAEQTRLETFGLRFASSMTPGDSGPLGLAMANAPDLLTAWRLFAACSALVADGGHWYFNQAGSMAKCVWGFSAYVTNRDQNTDFRAMLGIKNVRLYTGQNWYPSSLELQRKAPSKAGEHRRMLCPNIKFECFNNSMTLPAECLTAKRPDADVRVFEALKEQCEMATVAMLENAGFGQMIERYLKELLPIGQATLLRVAERMNVGERTLQRRLAAQGLRFDDLLDMARRELAESLVGDPQIPLVMIAKKCGYTSTSSFGRAFATWFGKRPHQVRQDLIEY